MSLFAKAWKQRRPRSSSAMVAFMTVVGVATAGSGLFTAPAGTAAEATTAPYTDPNAVGYIGLCNQAGQQITTGSVTSTPFVVAGGVLAGGSGPVQRGRRDSNSGCVSAHAVARPRGLEWRAAHRLDPVFEPAEPDGSGNGQGRAFAGLPSGLPAPLGRLRPTPFISRCS